MTPTPKTLTPAERHDLKGYEKVVRMGAQTFLEVGNALAQLRDRQLYRETHRSFEAYCADKWAMGKAYAYRLIDAAAVAMSLPADVANLATEGQARELSKVPAENRVEVLKAAGPKPTAKAIRKAAAPFVPKKSPQGGAVPAVNLSTAPAGSTPAPATTLPESPRQAAPLATIADAFGGNPKFFYARKLEEDIQNAIDFASDEQLSAAILAAEMGLKKLREEQTNRRQTTQP
jgi:hypothetical protein